MRHSPCPFAQVQALPVARITDIRNAAYKLRVFVMHIVRHRLEPLPVFPLCAARHEHDNRARFGFQSLYSGHEETGAIVLAVLEIQNGLAELLLCFG